MDEAVVFVTWITVDSVKREPVEATTRKRTDRVETNLLTIVDQQVALINI